MASTSKLLEIPDRTVKGYLIDRIRDAIASGVFKPGDRLNETRLAAEFNVSRIPVREALLQLQEQGLVMNRPRHGMFVTSLSEEDVQRINSLRIILEAEALKLCRANLTAAAEARLTSFVERLENWQSGIDIDACTLDLEFHRTIWKGAGNPYLEKTLNSLLPMLFSHHALAYANAPRAKHWPPNHHRALLDVIRGTSTVSAEMAMIQHLRLGCTNPERFSSLAFSREP